MLERHKLAPGLFTMLSLHAITLALFAAFSLATTPNECVRESKTPSLCLQQFLSSTPSPCTIDVNDAVKELCGRSKDRTIQDMAQTFDALSGILQICATTNDAEISDLILPAHNSLTAEHARFIAALIFRNLAQVLDGSGKPEGSKYTFDFDKLVGLTPPKSNLYAQALAFAWLYAGGRPTRMPGGQWSILQYALEQIDSTKYGSSMVRDLNHCLTDIKTVALFFGDAFIGGREGSYKKNDKDTHVKLEGSQTFETAKCMDIFISELLDKHHLKDVASLDALALLQHRIKWVGIVDKMLVSEAKAGGYDIVPILLDLFVHALPVGLEDAVMLPYGFANADGGHAMSLSLTRLSEKNIRLRVFNAGAGVQYHISNMLGSKAQALPYMQYDNIPRHLFMKSMFFHSFARIQNTQFRDKDVIVKDEQIYRRSLCRLSAVSPAS